MKKILLSVVVLVTVACLLAGCATAPPVPTHTGKPDVIIQSSQSAVFDALTAELLDNKYMLRSVNEAKSIAIYSINHRDMPIGGWVNAPVDQRAIVNFVQTSAGVRVSGTIEYIAYPGTGQARVISPAYLDYDAEGWANQQLYNSFLRVKQTIEEKQ